MITDPATIASIVLGTLLTVLILIAAIYKFPILRDTIVASFKSGLEFIANPKEHPEFDYWTIIAPGVILALAVSYFIAGTVLQQNAIWRSRPSSIHKLITIQQHDFSTPILSPLQSVMEQLSNSPYNSLTDSTSILVNWRPMTVRVTGYFPGKSSSADGVFDLSDTSNDPGNNNSIALALQAGAKAFVFDIDYLIDSPCVPVLVNRDDGGVLRSLNTGSIYGVCKTLATNAFKGDNGSDPILIILYIRRLPTSKTQQTNFLIGIAQGLLPLASNHLGSTENGNYHNCRGEASLFMNPISAYQKKFIIISNYDTPSIIITEDKRLVDPRNNLDFWTNARIWQDPSAQGSTVNATAAPPSPSPYAYIGSVNQYLNMSSDVMAKTATTNRGKFCIALATSSFSPSTEQLDTLLNKIGIQCVPIDVLTLKQTAEHATTLATARKTNLSTVIYSALTAAGSTDSVSNTVNYPSTNPKDPLSFWAYGGWSYIPKAHVYTLPTPQVPEIPSPATNSGGGLAVITG